MIMIFLFPLTTIHNSLSHAPAFLLCDVIMVMSDVMSHITDSVILSRIPGLQVVTLHVSRDTSL